MPKYDVKCDECDAVEEVTHRMSEDHQPCTECGGKVSTYFPIGTKLAKTQFKGSGWACKGE